MKKQTMPVEPDEFPVQQPTPEIKQPADPKEPVTPLEDPLREPQETPPEEVQFPETKPLI